MTVFRKITQQAARAAGYIRYGSCRDLRVHAAAAGLTALAWWGILYPELCFTDNTYECVTVSDGKEIEEETDWQDLFRAGGDEIVIKSRLVEWIGQKITGKCGEPGR